MPFIKIKVNGPVSEEQEIALKERLGKAIELVPGKSEEVLLLALEDNARLRLRGKNTGTAEARMSISVPLPSF